MALTTLPLEKEDSQFTHKIKKDLAFFLIFKKKDPRIKINLADMKKTSRFYLRNLI